METLPLQDPGPPLKLTDLEALEREIGGRLPDDYKEFMLAHNGGELEPWLKLVWNDAEEFLSSFNSLLPSASSPGIRQSLRRLRELNPTTTRGFLPIASTLGEQYLCLDVRGKIGAVYHTVYKYKTVYISDLVPVDVTLAPLANSFSEFLDSLTVDVPEPLSPIEELAQQGTFDDLEQFLAAGNSINSVTSRHRTVICAAIGFDNLPLIQACIERGASLSGTVMAAVESERPHLIRMLRDSGADINERDSQGRTPLACVGGWAIPGEFGVKGRELRRILLELGGVEE